MKEGLPSNNPANNGTLAGIVSTVLDKHLQTTDNSLPAKVIEYDREKNLATVQPLIAVLTTLGSTVSRAKIAQVPVLALGGGGFVINFPLKPGDLGWVEASDRDISLFLQSLKEARPNTLRKHSFEDAQFIPDVFGKYTIQAEDAENMVIQTLDGTVRIAIWPDKIKASAGDNKAEICKDGTISCVARQSVTAEAGSSKAEITTQGIALESQLIALTAHQLSLASPGLALTAPAGKPAVMDGDILVNGVSLKAFLEQHRHNAPGGQTGPPIL